jgi:hypothetical protein
MHVLSPLFTPPRDDPLGYYVPVITCGVSMRPSMGRNKIDFRLNSVIVKLIVLCRVRNRLEWLVNDHDLADPAKLVMIG